MKHQLWTVVSCLIIGFLCGVGTNQMTMAKDVSTQAAQITALQEKDKMLEKNAEKLDAKWEKRLDNVVKLLEASSTGQAASAQQQAELIRVVGQLIAQNGVKNQ